MSEMHKVCKTPPGQAVVTMRGGSRALYGFTAFPLAEAPSGAAVYVFARPSVDPLHRATSYWVPLYIGETGGMRECDEARLKRLEAARRLNATHMLIHFCNRDAETRRRIVHDLSRMLNTSRLNGIPRPAAA